VGGEPGLLVPFPAEGHHESQTGEPGGGFSYQGTAINCVGWLFQKIFHAQCFIWLEKRKI
jgi:hypothetical protein